MNIKWMVRSAVVLSVAGTTLFAQDGAGTGWAPALEFRVLASLPQGATANARADLKLLKSEPIAVTVWTGASLCSVGIGGGRDPMPSTAVQDNIWKLAGEYLGEQAGRHQVRVTAGFTRLAGRDSSGTTTQTLSLREGDNVVLDALSGPVGSGCPVHTVTVDARLVMQAVDPALARARYAADLWLVHASPDGQEQREHLVTNIDGSGPVPFMFNRLAFPVPQLDARQGNAEAVIQLTGALRARPRTDGLVDVDVETNRMIFGLEKPDSPVRPALSTTRKTLTLKSDETTAIDFPPPGSGFASLALDPGDSIAVGVRGGRAGAIQVTPAGTSPQARPAGTSAVEVKDGRLVLFTDRFFKGHRTQLLVTLRRLR